MFELPTPETFVKICGITRAEDAAVCAEAGATAIGINFYPKSKRYVRPEEARMWLGALTGGPARVALFVNARLPEIREAVDTGLFDAVQLHGDESPEFCMQVKALGLPLIRGVGLSKPDDIPVLGDCPADAFILDAPVAGAYGGTGVLPVGHWELARLAMERFPNRFMILSGGLSPGIVSRAVFQVHPQGVDVASGVESAPGIKDPEKVRHFIKAARTAPREFPTIPIDN